MIEIPKTYRENMAWRAALLRRCARDGAYRAAVKELFHRDVLFAFNAFFYTLDVRRRPEHHQPFCTYPYQDETLLGIVDAITRGVDLPIEKSRDMGASWMVILTFLWFWLNPSGGADFLLGSRIEDYVDKKGDMRTLLQKARYALYKLPVWLRPVGFSSKRHDNFMKLENPETGASITGESNNPNFSTGGRYIAVLFDEFAKWVGTDEQAWTAAGDATPCRLPVSTPFGAGGKYYEVIISAGNKVRLHWSKHPRKANGAYCVWPVPKQLEYLVNGWHNGTATEEQMERFWRSPWYDNECLRRPEEVAQELDIDYVGSGNPVFDGASGLRLAELVRMSRPPVAVYDFDLAAMGLVPKQGLLRDGAAGYLQVWGQPDKKHTYAIAVDVAEGTEAGDFSVMKVLDRWTKSVAASYYGKIDEYNLGKVIKIVAEHYRTTDAPWVAVETNGPGLSTFDYCAETFDVDNLFMMPNFDSAKETVSWRKGWRTNQTSKKILIGGLREWLENASGWADVRCVAEMQNFVRDKFGRPKARQGTHDDEVIALGIALQVDLLAPSADEVVERKVREDKVPEATFDWKSQKVVEPITLEERCMAHAMERRVLVDDVLAEQAAFMEEAWLDQA